MCDLGCGASLSTLEFTHAQDGKGLSRLVVWSDKMRYSKNGLLEPQGSVQLFNPGTND